MRCLSDVSAYGDQIGPFDERGANTIHLKIRSESSWMTYAGKPEAGIGVFCTGGVRPPVSELFRFIEDHRDICGGAPICRVLQIAPSTLLAHIAAERNPDRASDRAKRDAH